MYRQSTHKHDNKINKSLSKVTCIWVTFKSTIYLAPSWSRAIHLAVSKPDFNSVLCDGFRPHPASQSSVSADGYQPRECLLLPASKWGAWDPALRTWDPVLSHRGWSSLIIFNAPYQAWNRMCTNRIIWSDSLMAFHHFIYCTQTISSAATVETQFI